MSHLFNVAHTLRLLVQKERSLDILKVPQPVIANSLLMDFLHLHLKAKIKQCKNEKSMMLKC